jgi:undecaprenyl-diphosphatase
MNFFEAIFLGLVQGFTEWLPISSSGHLVVAHALFGIAFSPEFDVSLMIGTSLALVLFFRKRIFGILKGTLLLEKQSLSYLKLIILAGIPTALIGFGGKRFFESFFAMPFVVSLCIMLTGAFLLIVSRFAKKIKNGEVTAKSAFLVGVAQGIAVMPGISRSGSTIGTAMLFGVSAEKAAEFSFIVGLPAMIIASVIEFASSAHLAVQFDLVFAGIIASFVAGYFSIGFFMGLLKKGKLYYFGYYCLVAGALFAFLTFSI